MFDLLIGGPGETSYTAMETINKVKELDIPLAGIAMGVRVYPGTPFGKAVNNGFEREALHPKGEHALNEPVFYLSPALGENGCAVISDLVAGDERFLFLATVAVPGNYNCAGDETLSKMIARGARGAYWDILRHSR